MLFEKVKTFSAAVRYKTSQAAELSALEVQIVSAVPSARLARCLSSRLLSLASLGTWSDVCLPGNLVRVLSFAEPHPLDLVVRSTLSHSYKSWYGSRTVLSQHVRNIYVSTGSVHTRSLHSVLLNG